MTPREHQASGFRTAARTRAAILHAAGALVIEAGAPASLDAIAHRASVTKGGLLHHFPSKDLLLTALMTELLDDFRRAVHQSALGAPSDTGRLTRAYITAAFASSRFFEGEPNPRAITTRLVVFPALRRLAVADTALWRAELIEDGSDPSDVALVMAACDGLPGPSGDVLGGTDLIALREQLLRLDGARGAHALEDGARCDQGGASLRG